MWSSVPALKPGGADTQRSESRQAPVQSAVLSGSGRSSTIPAPVSPLRHLGWFVTVIMDAEEETLQAAIG